MRRRRTAVDWAEEGKVLLEEMYREAKRVLLVCDYLNTHKLASLYKVFPPEEAQRLCSCLELHYTPKQGSWLDIAEIEQSVFDAAVSFSAAAGLSDVAARDSSVGIAPACCVKRGGLAIYHTRCTHSIKKTLPSSSNLT